LDDQCLVVKLFNNIVVFLTVDLDNERFDGSVALDQNSFNAQLVSRARLQNQMHPSRIWNLPRMARGILVGSGSSLLVAELLSRGCRVS
jgi:hypothetical protein